MLYVGVIFWQKCMVVLDFFMEDKEVPMEIDILLLIKGRDPFLQIQKKMAPRWTSRRRDRHWPSLAA